MPYHFKSTQIVVCQPRSGQDASRAWPSKAGGVLAAVRGGGPICIYQVPERPSRKRIVVLTGPFTSATRCRTAAVVFGADAATERHPSTPPHSSCMLLAAAGAPLGRWRGRRSGSRPRAACPWSRQSKPDGERHHVAATRQRRSGRRGRCSSSGGLSGGSSRPLQRQAVEQFQQTGSVPGSARGNGSSAPLPPSQQQEQQQQPLVDLADALAAGDAAAAVAGAALRSQSPPRPAQAALDAAVVSAATADAGLLYPPEERKEIRSSWNSLMRWSRYFRCHARRARSSRPTPVCCKTCRRHAAHDMISALGQAVDCAAAAPHLPGAGFGSFMPPGPRRKASPSGSSWKRWWCSAAAASARRWPCRWLDRTRTCRHAGVGRWAPPLRRRSASGGARSAGRRPCRISPRPQPPCAVFAVAGDAAPA